jgi:hypothetical protein
MNGAGDHHVKQNKPDSRDTNIACFLSYMKSSPPQKNNDRNVKGGLYRKENSEVRRAKGNEGG